MTTPYDDLLTVVVPLDDGARRKPQPPPDFGGHGDLALGGEPRLREFHGFTLPR